MANDLVVQSLAGAVHLLRENPVRIAKLQPFRLAKHVFCGICDGRVRPQGSSPAAHPRLDSDKLPPSKCQY
ncbi:hypothetical protein B5K08_14000 [Rhizobium leguminosarum bv. trifolii]|uniref:Uncharacterized protein n=1 Tax=Rhizobium leguminosarum bv. trifolii TaxID=386 RepID=A0A3E1BJG2_RHILT|nr:hypothetical protein B5K08_14000 [Rhizobium leguminosarum bv. trifolii]RFB93064.1 hypothetical protein B5K10_13995 [Rhizobium leguminosarum bv. trifolii]